MHCNTLQRVSASETWVAAFRAERSLGEKLLPASLVLQRWFNREAAVTGAVRVERLCVCVYM